VSVTGLTEGGAPVFADPGTMPNSATAWLRLDSQEFTVYPRQKKTFKISIDIPDGVLEGSYRAAVFFEQPQPEETAKEEGTSVFLRGRLALPIYVTVGDAKPNGKILGASWKSLAEGRDPVVALQIRNEGTAHLRMNGIFSAVSLTDNKFEGIIPGVPILPGEERWIPLEFRGGTPPIFSELELSLLTDLGNGEIKYGTKVHGSGKNPDSK
jgi:fimbrial chaperone protein